MYFNTANFRYNHIAWTKQNCDNNWSVTITF